MEELVYGKVTPCGVRELIPGTKSWGTGVCHPCVESSPQGLEALRFSASNTASN